MLESIKTIIVPTDFSELSEAAVRSAGVLAAHDHASIHLLHVIRLPFVHTTYDVSVPESVWEGIRQGTREQMEDARSMLEKAGVSEVHSIVSEYLPPADAVAKAATDLKADLVVMATHGRSGLKHAFLGSVTERTIRSSPVPVLAIRGDGLSTQGIQRILLPTDFSTHSVEATTLACALAKRFGARIDLLHVLPETPSELIYSSADSPRYESRALERAGQQLDTVSKQLRDASLSAKTHLLKGVAPDAITEAAERLGSDLIVMGTHGFTGMAHAILGSTTERTLRLAPCPVLTTRARGDQSTEG